MLLCISDTLLIKRADTVVVNIEDISLKNRDNNMDNQFRLNEGEKIIRCSKNDGKGWQCRNESRQGYTLCDHHFRLLQSYNAKTNASSGSDSAIKSYEQTKKMMTTSTRPGRPRGMKKGFVSTSNAYEFYYYSGFGPFWSKRRGVVIENEKNNGRVNCKEIDKKKLLCVDEEKVDGNEKNDDNENKNSL